jgi:hypothetical protein
MGMSLTACSAISVQVHVFCWGFPLLWTTLQTVVSPGAFHEDLFESELRGIGWCGVDSTRRITKAVFVNTPQLISVSAYAQFYYYIHQKVDPEVDELFESTAKLSTSKNAKLMSLEAARKEAYIQETAMQLRLQMSAYMLSFLTNTVLSLVGDNLSDPAAGASNSNLIMQTGVVTCQGLLVGIVYARSASKSLLTAYFDTAGDLMATVSEQAAKDLMQKRALAKEAKARQLEARRRTKLTKPSAFATIQNVLTIFYQTILLYPVSVWVWVPMAFIAENTDRKAYIFIGLVIWSIASVFPIYAFSLVGADTTNVSSQGMQNIAQAYALFVVFISASAVYVNRYTHNLLMIERPCRYEGSMRNLFGPTQGFRFQSCRNSMSFFTLTLEFYQTFGLTWSATRMEALYAGVLDDDDTSFSGNLTDTRSYMGGVPKEVFTFWMVVGMVGGWVILYSFPAVVTTSTVGNRVFANNMQEMYRKYLWFMSGAGFLTVLKACMKILFCVPNLYDPTGPEVALTDYEIVCWSHRHLRMVAISLLCLVVFLPSATLTTLFRYDDEDPRGFPPFIQKTCVLGGEDIRWIHLWRRVEYLVKGMWVFSGMRFAKYGTFACVVLWAGSIIIATANYFMNPANLKFVCRQKLNIHVCNSWTTMVCFWAAHTMNDNKQTHYIMTWSGWIFVWLCLWGYELNVARKSPHKQPVGDAENIERSGRKCVKYRNFIMQSTGMSRWGNHSKIIEILNFCEHADIEVQRHGFRAFEQLAFCDQMTERYSFFLQLTTTNPTVQIMIRAIESSPDEEIRNLATRTMNCFLQSNASNQFGVLITFHATLQDHDDEKDGMVPVIVTKYATEVETLEAQIDALQLSLEIGQSDSNDIPAIAEVALPLLNEWMESGNLLQQYLASQLLMFIANRFDCVPTIIDEIGVKSLMTLFQCVCDSYGKFDGESAPSTTFGYKAGEDNTAPSKFSCKLRSLPKKFKRMLKTPGDVTTDYKGDEKLGVEEDYILDEDQIRMMQADILTFTIESLMDCAFSADADGRKAILDSDILTIVLSRCFEFDATSRPGSDAVDREVTTELHVEGCRIVQSLLSHAFSLQDIHIDDEMNDYYHQLQHFIHDGVDGGVNQTDSNVHAGGAAGDDEEEEAAEVHAFDSLTALQRRKAHIVAEFLGLEHESEGGPGKRVVLITRPDDEEVENPMDSKDEHTSIHVDHDESETVKEMYEDNFRRVANFGVAGQVLALAGRDSTDDQVIFNVCDVLLLLLEHDVLTDEAELEQVRIAFCTWQRGSPAQTCTTIVAGCWPVCTH